MRKQGLRSNKYETALLEGAQDHPENRVQHDNSESADENMIDRPFHFILSHGSLSTSRFVEDPRLGCFEQNACHNANQQQHHPRHSRGVSHVVEHEGLAE
ncbi:hypothetical protein D3C86_1877600 [compost metagenome]